MKVPVVRGARRGSLRHCLKGKGISISGDGKGRLNGQVVGEKREGREIQDKTEQLLVWKGKLM